MARFPYKRGPRVYPPIKDKLYKKLEDLGVTMNNDRTLLDREGRVLRKSRTYKQMGINEEDVRQRFRHYYYNEVHPWALEEIDIHIDPDIKEITPPPHMLPKTKKGRGGLIDFHKWKKKKKREKKKSGAELTAELLGKKQRLNRVVDRLFKHRKTPRLNPNKLEEIIIQPTKPDPITGRIREDIRMSRYQVEVKPGGRQRVYDIWDDTTNTFRKKPKFVHMKDVKGNIILKEQKNMGGLLSLYE